MHNPIATQVGYEAYNKIEYIYGELRKRNICVRKNRLWDITMATINEQQVIENLTKFKQREINKMFNNSYWDINFK